MGKRKSSAPQHVEEDKRRCLSWNMLDSFHSPLSLPSVPTPAPPQPGEGFLANQTTNLDNIAAQVTVEGVGDVKQQLSYMQELFNLHLQHCTTFLSVLDRLENNADNCFEIGRFWVDVGIEEGITLPPCRECWLYVGEEGHQHMLYFELTPPVDPDAFLAEEKEKCPMFWFADTTLPRSCLQILDSKVFKMVKGKFDFNSRSLEIIIYAKDTVLFKPTFPSEYIRPNKTSGAITVLMAHFYGIKLDDTVNGMGVAERQEVEAVYEGVKALQGETTVQVDVQHPCLKPVLRAYQRDAVCWMLQQEHYGKQQHAAQVQDAADGELHPLYESVTMRDGRVLYYNKHIGMLVEKRPVFLSWPPGGLLADEMGLGKTVEVLTCMLLHPRHHVPRPDRLPTLAELQAEASSDENLFTPEMHSNELTQSADDGMCTGGLPETNTPVCSEDNSILSVNQGTLSERRRMPCKTIENNIVLPRTLEPVMVKSQDSVCAMEHSLVECASNQQSPEGSLTSHKSSDESNLSLQDKTISQGYNKIEIYKTSKKERNVEFEILNFSKSVGENTPEPGSEKPTKPTGADDEKPPRPGHEKPAESKCKKSTEPQIEKPAELEIDMPAKPVVETNESEIEEPAKPERWTPAEPESPEKFGCENLAVKFGAVKRKKTVRKYEVLIEEKDFTPASFFSSLDPDPKQWFECVCGGDETQLGGRRGRRGMQPLTNVQCTGCGMKQHAQCLHYDLTNPYRGPYKCPHCHVSSPPLPSGATLIISPFSICHQWEAEIRKHIKQDSLRVFIYSGVNKQGFIQPQTLADCDIVITTYETLRKEVDYVDLPHCNSSTGRRFRHRKRFMATPSPIVAVEWWRICLDEAQMVECTTTKTAEMALRLSAVNRWCVTGTPIQKSLKDVYGLLLFLGMDPYWVEAWWRRLLYTPYTHGAIRPMYSVLARALWRTAKKDVLDQILLPPQSQEIHWLTFSPVEDHFYRRQYRDCVRDAFKRLSRWKDNTMKLSSMDRHTMSQVLQPLLRLRQACCHPQAVRGEFLPLNKNTLSMEELLETLTRRSRVESEEAHRQLVAALNGLAAIHIIKHQYEDAVDFYRQVLRSIDEHADRLRTDELQQLHALHNLQEVLQLSVVRVQPTLRDHQLKLQIGELRDKYLLKAAGKLTAAMDSLYPTQQGVKDTKKECEQGGEWWSDLVDLMAERGLADELVEKIRDDIETHSSPEAGLSMSSSFRDVSGLEYCVYTNLSGIERSHKQVVQAVLALQGGLRKGPNSQLLNQTVECCLRPVKQPLAICCFCKTDELFKAYESKLFSFKERGLLSAGQGDSVTHQVNTKRQGTWADSDVEKALKSLISFCKHHGVSMKHKNLLETGAAHIKLLDMMKKEFKLLRAVWLSAREQVSALDELNMATTRLRQRLPDEPKSDPPQPNILEKGEVDMHRLRLVADRENAASELRKKLGQLLYLTNLANSQEGKDTDGANPEPCPVCQRGLGVEWSVLLCGHCYCLDCMRTMLDQYSFGGRNRSLKCALCRQATHHSDISYVSTRRQNQQDPGQEVQGSHSTKVGAVVKCIKNIHRQDPTAKALVFSSWQDVLDVIGQALQQNGCTFTALYTPGKFQQHLKTFKEDENVQTLLIPLHSGANGLNLIEANHVLLVEPILNPAEELQAIGRVHRIGQTRPTHVHKFLVRGTIEQRIYKMVKNMSSNGGDTEDHAMTIGDLTALFTEVTVDTLSDTQIQHGQLDTRDDTSVPSSSSMGDIATTSTSSQEDIATPSTSSMEDIATPSTSSMVDIATPSTTSREDIATPSTSSMEDIAIPSTSSMEDIATPSTSSMEDIATPSTSSMEDIAIPSTGSREDIAILSTCSREDIAILSTCSREDIAILSTCSREEIATRSTSSMEYIATTSTDSREDIAIPSTSSMDETSLPSTSSGCDIAELQTTSVDSKAVK